MTTQAVGDRRLLRLADILDVADAKHRADKKPKYAQEFFRHDCGTPACALGHYAAATPRRWFWDSFVWPQLRTAGHESPLDDAAQEFYLSNEESRSIFGGQGCGAARTAKQAAKFIRKFVKARARGNR